MQQRWEFSNGYSCIARGVLTIRKNNEVIKFVFVVMDYQMFFGFGNVQLFKHVQENPQDRRKLLARVGSIEEFVRGWMTTVGKAGVVPCSTTFNFA